MIHYAGAEIGKEFYYQRKKLGFATQVADELFEEEVTDAEIRRDWNILKKGYPVSVIETWHPGNLAYAVIRNPSFVKKLSSQILASSPLLQGAAITGINIKVSRENILQRTRTFASNPDWAADFYSRISSVLPSCIEMLNLGPVTHTIDGNGALEDTYNQICRIISGKGTVSNTHLENNRA